MRKHWSRPTKPDSSLTGRVAHHGTHIRCNSEHVAHGQWKIFFLKIITHMWLLLIQTNAFNRSDDQILYILAHQFLSYHLIQASGGRYMYMIFAELLLRCPWCRRARVRTHFPQKLPLDFDGIFLLSALFSRGCIYTIKHSWGSGFVESRDFRPSGIFAMIRIHMNGSVSNSERMIFWNVSI